MIPAPVQRSHSQKKQLLLVAQSLPAGPPDCAVRQNDVLPPQRDGSPPLLLPPADYTLLGSHKLFKSLKSTRVSVHATFENIS